jgi:hypothetical protein
MNMQLETLPPSAQEPPQAPSLYNSGNSNNTKVAMARAMQFIQMQFQAASNLHRDINAITLELLEACKDVEFCEQPSALYAYYVGGKLVCGPGIRILEEAARAYGGIAYDWEVIDSNDLESTVRVFAIDLKKIVSASRIVKVKHGIMKRQKDQNGKDVMRNGKPVLFFDPLTDEDQIYVRIANYANRRKRAVLEEVMPKIMVMKAYRQAHETLKNAEKTPLPVRINQMVEYMDKKHSIPKEAIEKKYGKPVEKLSVNELVELKAIAGSLKDEGAKPEDFFESLKPVKPPEAKPPEAYNPASVNPPEAIAAMQEAVKQNQAAIAAAAVPKSAEAAAVAAPAETKNTAATTAAPAVTSTPAENQSAPPAQEIKEKPKGGRGRSAGTKAASSAVTSEPTLPIQELAQQTTIVTQVTSEPVAQRLEQFFVDPTDYAAGDEESDDLGDFS